MQRRKFLQDLISVAGLLAAGSVPYGIAKVLTPEQISYLDQKLIRPPGAIQDDDEFIAACIGCGLCGEVCPPKCILFHGRGGGKEVNTPYIIPAEKSCILCDKCMDACPTEALTVIDRDKINMGIAQIDRTACYPWVDRGVCGACVAVCPLGDKAIVYDFANMYRPVVKKGCVGCGQCVEVCPQPSLPIAIVTKGEGTVA
jgi:ferredoxin-type protein NapG